MTSRLRGRFAPSLDVSVTASIAIAPHDKRIGIIRVRRYVQICMVRDFVRVLMLRAVRAACAHAAKVRTELVLVLGRNIRVEYATKFTGAAPNLGPAH